MRWPNQEVHSPLLGVRYRVTDQRPKLEVLMRSLIGRSSLPSAPPLSHRQFVVPSR